MTDKEIVLAFIKAINDHDVEKINYLMSDDHVFIDGYGEKHVGKNVMKEGWHNYYQMFPDYIIDVTDVTQQNSIFGLFGYASGTFKSIEGNYWKATAAWKAIVQNKKIKQWQVYCDYSRLMEIVN